MPFRVLFRTNRFADFAPHVRGAKSAKHSVGRRQRRRSNTRHAELCVSVPPAQRVVNPCRPRRCRHTHFADTLLSIPSLPIKTGVPKRSYAFASHVPTERSNRNILPPRGLRLRPFHRKSPFRKDSRNISKHSLFTMRSAAYGKAMSLTHYSTGC